MPYQYWDKELLKHYVHVVTYLRTVSRVLARVSGIMVPGLV